MYYLRSLFLKRHGLHLLATGLNPLQQLIFIEVELLTPFVSRNQSFTRKRVNSRLCLSCDFTGFVNFNKTMLVGRSLRLQCCHHLPDLFHLFCEITYRLRQLIKSDLFICHTYSFLIVRWQRKLVFWWWKTSPEYNCEITFSGDYRIYCEIFLSL